MVVAVAGGAVKADALHRQGVDLTAGDPEPVLQGMPEFRVAEAAEYQGEAVVGEVDVADGLPGAGLQGVARPSPIPGRGTCGDRPEKM